MRTENDEWNLCLNLNPVSSFFSFTLPPLVCVCKWKNFVFERETNTFTSNHHQNIMKKSLLLLIAIVGLFTTSFATTWYVNVNATGSNTGTSWTNAYTDLQSAIAASTFGDEIWVAAGTYKPTTSTTRTIYFQIKNGTKVYGGFNGSETLLSERNSVTNVTILSGDIATASVLDNSYHVVYFLNTGNQTLINGFTITGGIAILNGSADAGGGVYASNSSAVVEKCTFVSNAGDYGGAFAQVNTGICTVKDCIFEANLSYTVGGAVYLSNDQAFFTDCYFASNQSNGDGGAVYLNSSVFDFDRCVFAGNTSADDGSAFYVGNFAALILSNSLVVGNYASGQEVISMNETFNQEVNKLINCTVAHNRQLQNGAGTRAITMNNLSTIDNSIIWDNGGDSEVMATGTVINNCIIQPAVNNAPGTNVLSADPLFVVPGSLTSAPFDTTGFDYHLSLFSSGINAGLNAAVSGSADLDAQTRIQGTVDLGAYESAFCTSPLTLDQSAPFVICGGTPITLSVSGAATYAWSSGSSSSSITVSTAGNYTVIFEDSSGCRGELNIPVTSGSLPTPIIVFSAGSLSAGTFSTYQWSYNGNPINGATDATHIPLEGYGEYTVDVTNAAGCESSDSFCLSPATISANGPTTFCEGGSVTLTAENGSGFVWSNNELDSEITVSTGGTYTVTVFDSSAGCAVTLSQLVTVVPNPTPVINYSGGNLVTGAFSTYQWYYNGTAINGATSPTLVPANGNGPYTVVVTNSTGCEDTSAVYNYSNVGLSEVLTEETFFFPNPVSVSGTLTINTHFVVQEMIEIRLYDLSGKVCFCFNAAEMPTSVALSGIQPGVYIAELTVDQTIRSRQQIVLY
jgi:hypothetical protein